MIKPGLYKHYKGGIYVVKNVATHTETGELFVVYYAEKDPNQWWIRPVEMFCGYVNDQKRFVLIKCND